MVRSTSGEQAAAASILPSETTPWASASQGERNTPLSVAAVSFEDVLFWDGTTTC